ncbi:MAG: nitrile hydratase accessory protein [Leptolyngbyaceae cyanobacterium]
MSSSSPDPLSTPESPEVDHEPVFQAPWEAKAFAIVNQLAAAQEYSWAEWTEQFVAEISAAEADSADGRTYYERWVDACEKLLITKGILDTQSIDQRIQELLIEQEHQH